jgi:hypothetical protein
MEAVTTRTLEAGTDARRARFREAVTKLSGKARSGDLLRMVLVPGSILVVGGLSFILMGWWGASHTHREIEQIPYLISGAILGLAMVVLGGLLLASAIWMSTTQAAQQQAEERTAAHLRELVAQMQQTMTPPAPPEPTAARRNGRQLKASTS